MQIELSNPIEAQTYAFEILKSYNETENLKTRIKLKRKLIQTSNRARSQGHTFVASIYLTVL